MKNNYNCCNYLLSLKPKYHKNKADREYYNGDLEGEKERKVAMKNIQRRRNYKLAKEQFINASGFQGGGSSIIIAKKTKKRNTRKSRSRSKSKKNNSNL